MPPTPRPASSSDAFPVPFGLASPHAQTVWASVVRSRARVNLTHECWPTSDGDSIDLEVAEHKPGAPGLLVLHGLEGSSNAKYVRGLLAGAHARGWNAAGLNFRGCGPTPHKHARTYHSGFTDDLELVATTLKSRWGRLAVGGFSLGGNVTLKWLGERGADAAADAGVAISVPFDLERSAGAIDSRGFWGWVYRERFLRSLRSKALRTHARHPGTLDEREIRGAASFSAFDHVVTAKINGFASAKEYWSRSSSAQFVDRIRKPTLLISAIDDPMVPGDTIPRAAAAANPAITLRVTDRGGHVGFVGGSLLEPRYLAEEWALEFLAERFA